MNSKSSMSIHGNFSVWSVSRVKIGMRCPPRLANGGCAQRLRLVVARGLRNARLDWKSFNGGFAQKTLNVGAQIQKVRIVRSSERSALRQTNDVGVFATRDLDDLAKRKRRRHLSG